MSEYFRRTKRDGIVLSTQPFWNGNVLGSTAAWWMLSRYAERAVLQGIKDCEVTTGLYSRYDDKVEITRIDDYVCLVCIPMFAKGILQHGRENNWFFGGNSLAQWFGRYPAFIAQAKMTNGEKLSKWDQFAWIAALYIAALKPLSNQDSWMQSHLMVISAENNGYVANKKWFKKAIAFWRSRKGLPTYLIVANYLGLTSHPLIDAWREYN